MRLSLQEATEAIYNQLDSNFYVIVVLHSGFLVITNPKTNGTLLRRLIPVGIEERWATVNGYRMRYLFGGSGPPLLLVHGLMGFSFSWSENLSVFAENCTIHAPDLLNVGYSDRCDLDPDLKTTASQLLQFMDAVGIETTDLLGTSYGGTLAMALAASVPNRISRLILVAPAHCGSEGNRWQSRFFSSRPGGIAAQLIHLAPAFVHAYFIKRMYSKPSRALAGTVEEYSAALRKRGTIAPMVKLMHCWTRNFAALASMMPSIAEIPTLLVWGKNDGVVPIQTMDSLAAKFRTAQISIIDDAGHLPYEELPEEFNRAVLQYLLQSVPQIREADAGLR